VGCPRKVWLHCDPEIPKHASSLYRISARNRIWHNFGLWRWTMSSNLFSWSFMLLWRDQRMTLSRSSCSNFTSCSLEICLLTLVSSAKKLTLECETQSWRSLMDKMNNNGPRTVPWGTPLMIEEMIEWIPLTTTDCFRLHRSEESKVNVSPTQTRTIHYLADVESSEQCMSKLTLT
jgi:hypothetical protein